MDIANTFIRAFALEAFKVLACPVREGGRLNQLGLPWQECIEAWLPSLAIRDIGHRGGSTKQSMSCICAL